MIPAPAVTATEHAAIASKISTLILQATVFLAAGLTGWMGVDYWLDQGEPIMAGATVIAEIIAVLLPTVAVRRLRIAPTAAAIGFILTTMAALWCGGTTWAKLDADFNARAAAQLYSAPAYQDAERAYTSAASALNDHLSARPPACACPATISAWQRSHETQARLLEQERTNAQERLRQVTPRRQVSFWAIARAVFLEAIKLFGLIACGSSSKAPPAAATRSNRRTRAAIALAVTSGVAPLTGVGASMAPNIGDMGAQSAIGDQARATAPQAAIVQPIAKSAQRRADQAKAREMALSGMHKTEIARQLGVHRNTVHNWLRLGA